MTSIHASVMSVVMLLSLGLPTRSQVITGRVVIDPTRAPAANVVSVLVGDSAGVFAIAAPGAGVYRVLFFPPGGGVFSVSPIVLDSTTYVEREFHIAADTARPRPLFLDREADRRAVLQPGGHVPRYPVAQWRRGTRGRVSLFFVVDEQGRLEPASVQFVSGSEEAFVDAVRQVLDEFRFWPAQRGGNPVRQVAQMTVDFGCPGDPDSGDIVIRANSPACVLGRATDDDAGGNGTAASQGASTVQHFASPQELVLADTAESQMLPPIIAPRYPSKEKMSGVKAAFAAVFVIDTLGRVELPSVTFVGQHGPAFRKALCTALQEARFRPVRRDVQPRRAIVVGDWTFTLAGDPEELRYDSAPLRAAIHQAGAEKTAKLLEIAPHC